MCTLSGNTILYMVNAILIMSVREATVGTKFTKPGVCLLAELTILCEAFAPKLPRNQGKLYSALRPRFSAVNTPQQNHRIKASAIEQDRSNQSWITIGYLNSPHLFCG